jgi:hypothetical protein
MAGITTLWQRRTLAELNATIERTECARREQLAAVARLGAAGKDLSPARALLQLTDDYLACLRQSRAILLWELPRDEDRRPGAAPTAVCRTTGKMGVAGVRPRLVE